MKKQLELTKKIAEAVRGAGGRALIVGGFARDEIMRRWGTKVVSKDIDVEVYGLAKNELENLLKRFGEVKEIGKQYEVFKLRDDDLEIDVSLPRRDRQVGPKHTDIETEYDPNMSFEEAFRRRDFTINAIGLDPLTEEVIDVYGGADDINKGIIRMVDRDTFGDDPLRPLRAAQFAGRFGFQIDPETVKTARKVDMTGLPAGRVGEEWIKMLSLSPKPSIGLRAAHEIGVIKQLHSELDSLLGTKQALSKLSGELDQVAGMDLGPNDRLNLMLAVLVKDMDEPKRFLKELEISKDRMARIVKLVAEKDFELPKKDQLALSVNNLAVRLFPATIEELARLIEITGGDAKNLIAAAREYGVLTAPPEHILEGRHLIEMGIAEGPKIGRIVDKVYQAQLDGEVKSFEEAKSLAKKLYGRIT